MKKVSKKDVVYTLNLAAEKMPRHKHGICGLVQSIAGGYRTPLHGEVESVIKKLYEPSAGKNGYWFGVTLGQSNYLNPNEIREEKLKEAKENAKVRTLALLFAAEFVKHEKKGVK